MIVAFAMHVYGLKKKAFWNKDSVLELEKLLEKFRSKNKIFSLCCSCTREFYLKDGSCIFLIKI